MAFFEFKRDALQLVKTLATFGFHASGVNVGVLLSTLHYFLKVSVGLLELLSFFWELLTDIIGSKDALEVAPFVLDINPEIDHVGNQIKVCFPLADSALD